MANNLALAKIKQTQWLAAKAKNIIYGQKQCSFVPNSYELEENIFGELRFTRQYLLDLPKSVTFEKFLSEPNLDSIIFDRAESGGIECFFTRLNGGNKRLLHMINMSTNSIFNYEFKLDNFYKKYKNEILCFSSGFFYIFNNVEKKCLFCFSEESKNLFCMLDNNIYFLNMKNQKIVIHTRPNNEIRTINFQSTTIDVPFYFPLDIKQFECADGIFIWLNETKLQILNRKSGEEIKSIYVTADKFVLNSKNEICLINQAVQKLQVYEEDGTLLTEYQVEESLIDQTFFLDRQDKFLFFNKTTFKLFFQ